MTASERIAEFAVALHYEDLPAETVAAAKLHAELESAALALESAETLAPFAILGQAREPAETPGGANGADVVAVTARAGASADRVAVPSTDPPGREFQRNSLNVLATSSGRPIRAVSGSWWVQRRSAPAPASSAGEEKETL